MAPAWAITKFVPKDFTDASQIGGVLTVSAYAAMVLVFLCEVGSFIGAQPSSTVMLETRAKSLININFEIDMYDIECRNLKVELFSQHDDTPVPMETTGIFFRTLDKKGRTFGMAKKMDEFSEFDAEADHEKTMKQLEKEDGRSELDADWSSSHDGFKHQSFEHVIKGHDFTFINFFAGWCSHCQKFSPAWGEMADEIHGVNGSAPIVFHDRDGVSRGVRLIKMNCVDFGRLCQEKGIDAYPSLRLYKGDGTFSVYEGRRDKKEIIRWIERTVKLKSYGWADHHEAFERGCNVKGKVMVPTLPGRLEFAAGGGDQNLNSYMTNVSHLIKAFSFSPTDTIERSKAPLFPAAAPTQHTNAMDGRNFATMKYHEAWVHELKVMRMTYSKSRRGGTFVFTHQHHVQKLGESEIPQARRRSTSTSSPSPSLTAPPTSAGTTLPRR